MYYSMPKDTCQAEATPNSEKTKPIHLAVIKLHLSKDIGMAVSQSVSRKKILLFNKLLECFRLHCTVLSLVILEYKRSGTSHEDQKLK